MFLGGKGPWLVNLADHPIFTWVAMVQLVLHFHGGVYHQLFPVCHDSPPLSGDQHHSAPEIQRLI